MNGILLINKPKNWTSRDVVNKISEIYKTKKVGHTGTLDPMATGVLVICIGKYTKLVSELTSLEKEYIATMKLGIETTTLDNTGTIVKEQSIRKTKEEITKAFQEFPKSYDQEVPIYSAVKVNGKKLYEYARKNQQVKLPKRKVEIKKLEILSIKDNDITFKTTVSKGTYIRSLIRDLALSLNTIAVMTELKRTKQGNFVIENCQNLEEITPETKLLSIDKIWQFPSIPLKKEEYQKVQNGNKIKLDSSSEYVFVTYKQEKIAIYQNDGEWYRFKFFLK